MIEHIGKYPDNLGVGAKISQLGPKSINSKNLINYTSKDTSRTVPYIVYACIDLYVHMHIHTYIYSKG